MHECICFFQRQARVPLTIRGVIRSSLHLPFPMHGLWKFCGISSEKTRLKNFYAMFNKKSPLLLEMRHRVTPSVGGEDSFQFAERKPWTKILWQKKNNFRCENLCSYHRYCTLWLDNFVSLMLRSLKKIWKKTTPQRQQETYREFNDELFVLLEECGPFSLHRSEERPKVVLSTILRSTIAALKFAVNQHEKIQQGRIALAYNLPQQLIA